MRVLICQCKTHKRLDPVKLEKIVNLLKSGDIPYTPVEDLCFLSAKYPKKIAESDAIIGCSSRALEALSVFSEAEKNTKTFDLNKLEVNEIIAELYSLKNISTISNNNFLEDTVLNQWLAWFPVIDITRCVQCGKCSDFCMFGTFKMVDGVVKVVNPSACKTDCPACARICPENAIIFPKSGEAHINGSINEKIVPDEKSESSFKARLEKRKAYRLFKDDKR